MKRAITLTLALSITAATMGTSTASAEEPKKPAPAASAAAPTSGTSKSGLKWEVIKAGAGESPKTGEKVQVHYVGTLTDGKKFDSSRDRGQPFEFPLGQGKVIKGWDEGVAMMKPGAVYKFTIPANLAYGDKGAGGVIPPNSTLVFEVEFIKVVK